VGSISKSVAAWGVMRLVETGRMDLDAPVESYPTRWHLPPSEFDSAGVTIGRLLSHTAGINSQDNGPVTTRPLPTLEESMNGGSGMPGDRLGSDDVRITAAPGSGFTYSNGGYSLLQLAVEEVVGESFATYMQREVLAPLGMTRSSFTESAALAAVTATGYTGAPPRAVPAYAFTEQAAGGLYTSATDVARFVAAGMTGPGGEPRGRGILTPTGVEALFRPMSILDGNGMPTSLAYELETLSDGTQSAAHGGKNTGWLSQFITIPGRAEGLVVLTNSDSSGPVGLAAQDWADALGVGAPKTSRMIAAELDPYYWAIGVTGGLLGLVTLVIVYALLRGRGAGRRTWMWRRGNRPPLAGWAVRFAVLLTVFTLPAGWWVQPIRATLTSIAPLLTTLTTVALFALCLAAAAAVLTRARSVSAPAEPTPVVAGAGHRHPVRV